MKNQICTTLFLSLALVPATSAQTASQSGSDKEPLQAPTSKNFWDDDDPNVVNLIAHPFASKKYVQRHTQTIRDRIDELDELTSENSRKIKDVDARSQQGIQLASKKASLAEQHATDAGNQAQLAQTAATAASMRESAVERMINNLDQYKGTAQTEIRFRPGQNVLSKNAKDALDQMAGPLKDQQSYIIEVRAFAPGRSQAGIASSQKMADSVVRYLVLTHQIPLHRIYAMSLGNAPMAGEGTTAKLDSGGRVEISVLKNDLVSSAER
jgi:outer membrane protein OmpA-like peptidoglycan-associated protein